MFKVVVHRLSSWQSILIKSQTIWENGRDLLEVKEMLDHGEFEEWCESNFPWSLRTVNRMMNVSKNAKLADLNFSPSTLYLLSEPSIPETAREEAIERAEEGETVTHKEVKELVDAPGDSRSGDIGV
jgi:hypothetical protein